MFIQSCFKNSVATQVAACMMVVGAVVSGGSVRCVAQENTSVEEQTDPSADDNSKDQKLNAKSGSQKSNRSSDKHADDESPALGVLVGVCPGNGVCVIDTVSGSPAEQAGIIRGDYILSLDDKRVSTPGQLREMVKKHRPGEKVHVTIWRQGEETTREVTLATESKEPPASHKAWLGVMLKRGEEGQSGIVIASVHPASPADDVGLQKGDVIKRMNGNEITSIEQFANAVRDFNPGAKLKLTIQRNGTEQLLSVVLGRVDEAPLLWLRRAFRPSSDDFGAELPPWDEMTDTEMMDEVLDEMRKQIRELQKEVSELKLQQSPDNKGGKGQQQKSNREKKTKPADKQDAGKQGAPKSDSEKGQADSDKMSSLDPLMQESLHFVVQRDGRDLVRFGARGHRWNHRDHRHWQYHDRDYPPYGRIYRRPGYGSSYYYYRGRPYYYYGGTFRYGPRGAVLVGPNFGIYWY